jgi:hypothetical protein
VTDSNSGTRRVLWPTEAERIPTPQEGLLLGRIRDVSAVSLRVLFTTFYCSSIYLIILSMSSSQIALLQCRRGDRNATDHRTESRAMLVHLHRGMSRTLVGILPTQSPAGECCMLGERMSPTSLSSLGILCLKKPSRWESPRKTSRRLDADGIHQMEAIRCLRSHVLILQRTSCGI